MDIFVNHKDTHVKCISNAIGLTVGKTYKIISFSYNFTDIIIVDDFGFDDWYPIYLFVDIQEERDRKINELGL